MGWLRWSRSPRRSGRGFGPPLGLDEDTFTLGILARLEEYKGHVYLAQAARILKEQGRKFRILAAGDRRL